MTDRPDNRSLFDAARKVSVLELAQRFVTLRRASGGTLVGPCPLCGGDKKSTRFKVDPRRNNWTCWAGTCGNGDVIALEQKLGGGSALDAAKRLAGHLPVSIKPIAENIRAAQVKSAAIVDRAAARSALAQRIWLRAEPAIGTKKEPGLVARYFAARGLDHRHPVIAHAITRLRFAPRALAWQEKDERTGEILWQRFAPAMIAPVKRRVIGVDGAARWTLCGVHMTFIAPDGGGKALMWDDEGGALEAKKMVGEISGGAVLFTNPDRFARDGRLVVGEGVESTLALACSLFDLQKKVAPAAAMTLTNLQGGWLADEWGRVSVTSPRIDPDHPPFVFPAPHEGARVLIGVDHDMAEVTVKQRAKIGFAEKVTLGAADRARICASLTRQAWEAAGWNATPLTPPAGCDFLDAYKRARA